MLGLSMLRGEPLHQEEWQEHEQPDRVSTGRSFEGTRSTYQEISTDLASLWTRRTFF
jgi:hypothetical protein